MEILKTTATIVSGLLLAGCGGGGGGGGIPVVKTVSISGTVTPPSAPMAVTALSYPGYAGATASTDMLLPLNSPFSSYATIVQSMDYVFDQTVFPTLKVDSLSISPVEPASPTALSTGPLAYASDPTLGRLNQIATSSSSARVSAFLTFSSIATMGGMPAAAYSSSNITGFAVGYVLPLSATLNPTGYTYQTIGSWLLASPAHLSETWFSMGIPTAPATLPAVGAAIYTGRVAGSLVDVATRDQTGTSAAMNATVDFGARTVAIAAISTLPTGNSGLNMNGTLSYAAGSNTFTGAVSTANGMSGNATCRFYGPGIAASTATKVLHAPTEIGCTFVVMSTSVGAMEGAFGGN